LRIVAHRLAPERRDAARNRLEKHLGERRCQPSNSRTRAGPRIDGHRPQAHFLAHEKLTSSISGTQQLAFERVGPAVVAALKRLPFAASVRDRAGAVQATL
jgi:hypothetical protein